MTESLKSLTTEDGLALEFAERHSGQLRYVHSTSPRKWFVLDEDGDWKADTTLLVHEMVRALCREASAQCSDSVVAREVASAATIYAVERLARSDRRLAATREEVGLPPPGKRKAKGGAKAKAKAKAGTSTTAADAADVTAKTDSSAARSAAAEAIIARASRGRVP